MTLQEWEKLVSELQDKGILRNFSTITLLTQKLAYYFTDSVQNDPPTFRNNLLML